MPRRFLELNGERWEVAPSGRITQYSRDEFGVLFTRTAGGPAERRVARFTPLATKGREEALARLSDAELLDLLRRSQPAWTAPDTGYRS